MACSVDHGSHFIYPIGMGPRTPPSEPESDADRLDAPWAASVDDDGPLALEELLRREAAEELANWAGMFDGGPTPEPGLSRQRSLPSPRCREIVVVDEDPDEGFEVQADEGLFPTAYSSALLPQRAGAGPSEANSISLRTDLTRLRLHRARPTPTWQKWMVVIFCFVHMLVSVLMSLAFSCSNWSPKGTGEIRFEVQREYIGYALLNTWLTVPKFLVAVEMARGRRRRRRGSFCWRLRYPTDRRLVEVMWLLTSFDTGLQWGVAATLAVAIFLMEYASPSSREIFAVGTMLFAGTTFTILWMRLRLVARRTRKPRLEVILQPKQKFGNITAVEAEKCNCCSICLDSFNNDDEVIELQCLHIFHRTCGMEWLRRGKGCPLRCPVQEA